MVQPANRRLATEQHVADELAAGTTPVGGAGGALSGSYPNPGLNTAAVDTSVAAAINDAASDTAVALRAASVALVAGDIDDPGTDIGAAAAAAFLTRGVRVADLARPFFIPHRGAGAQVFPENTLEAFRIGASYGLGIVDGGDWRLTGDGALVSCHDATLDRTTRLSGPISGLSSLRAQDTIVDPSTWFGPGYPDMRMPTAEQLFGELGVSTVLVPEPKELGAAVKLAELIDRMGIQPSVLANAFSLELVQPFLDVGCTDVLINTTTPPSSATLAAWWAAGVRWVGVPLTYTTAQVQAIRDVGFEVLAGTLTGRTTEFPAGYLGAGLISAWAADDPLYVAHGLNPALASRYRRTTDPFLNQRYYHGHLQNSAPFTARGTYIANRWAPSTAAGIIWVTQGWGCPLANPSSYTMTFDLVFDAHGADTTRWGGVFLDAPTDLPYGDTGTATENGVQVWFRVNGQLSATRKTNGAASPTQAITSPAVSVPLVLSAALASGVAVTALPVTALVTAIVAGQRFALPTGQIVTASAGAAIGATSVPINSVTPTEAVASGASIPQAVQIRIVYTNASVVATQLDTNHSVTVTATGNNGAYFHFGKNAAVGGLQVSFANVAIT